MIFVLAYHNVCEPGQSTSWLTVPQDSFRKQMLLLKKFTDFVHPENLFAGELDNRSKPQILLTFDDGFQGSYRYAVPVLRDLGVPALFFVSTANMLEQKPFWFEEIINLVKMPCLTEVDLRNVGLDRYQMPAGSAKARWTEISRLLEDIKRRDVFRPEDDIAEIITCVSQQCPDAPVPETFSRPLTAAQVQELNLDELFMVGSHSHHHRILTHLDDQELAFELAHSKLQLEQLLGEKVESIAYPNGNVDSRVGQASKRAGYSWGFSVGAGAYNGSSTPLQIPRKLIGGFDSTLQFSRNMLREYLKFRAM